MQEEIKDSETINKFIDTLFGVLPVYMVLDGKPQHIKIITNTSQGLVIKPPPIEIKEGNQRILTITNSGSLYLFIFEKLGSQAGYELLKPLQVSIKKAQRQAERIEMSSQDFRIFVTNIIKQGEIGKYLSGDSAKVSAIVKNHLQKLNPRFTNVNIYIQERYDHFMRLLNNYDKPFFIADAAKPEDIKDDYIPYAEYLKLQKTYKRNEKFIAEIAYPIKYRNYFLIGYIHATHKEPLDFESFNFVKLTANNLKRELVNSGIVQLSREICEIADLSDKGLSFLHPPNKINNKLFVVGDAIIFDIVFSEEHKATIRAIVRNINALEKDFRIGCQFYPQSDYEMESVREFLVAKTKKDLERKKKNEE